MTRYPSSFSYLDYFHYIYVHTLDDLLSRIMTTVPIPGLRKDVPRHSQVDAFLFYMVRYLAIQTIWTYNLKCGSKHSEAGICYGQLTTGGHGAFLGLATLFAIADWEVEEFRKLVLGSRNVVKSKLLRGIVES